MAQFRRAFDISITIRVNGEPQVPLSANSGTFNRGLTTEEVPLVGKDVPAVDGINGLKVLTLDLNANPWLCDLLDAQEKKNAGLAEVDIDAEFSVNYGQGIIVRYLMAECVAHEPGTTFGGSTERITEALTLTTDTLVRR